MHVAKHIAGSYCVVFLGYEHYIDAKKTHSGNLTYVEVVRSGQVYKRFYVWNFRAAESIIELMRAFKRGESL